jgi:hypothetical protein
MRYLRDIWVALALAACVGAGRADEDHAVQALQQLGAIIKRDETRPSRPVVAVGFGVPWIPTDTEFELVMGIADLERLGISATQTKGMDAKLKELKDLKDLEVLDLWATDVTDAGLKELKGMEHLRTLNLCATKVTGASLKDLKELKNLRKLSLTLCPVTAASRARALSSGRYAS